MGIHGILWGTDGLRKTVRKQPWDFSGFYWILLEFMGFYWILLDFMGSNFLGFYGILWEFMGFYGNSWFVVLTPGPRDGVLMGWELCPWCVVLTLMVPAWGGRGME